MKSFNILISSDVGYDDLCAEIFFENEFVAIISQEEGADNMQIEIHPPRSQEFWTFNFAEFENIIKEAKETLLGMQKESE